MKEDKYETTSVFDIDVIVDGRDFCLFLALRERIKRGQLSRGDYGGRPIRAGI